MKRFFTIAMSAVLLVGTVFGLSGCGLSVAKAPYTAEVSESFITNTYEGKALVINLDVENTGDSKLDGYSISRDVIAKLDGKTLSTGYLSESDSEDYIDPGITILAGDSDTVQLVYSLGDAEEGEVSLKCVSTSSKAKKDFDIMDETIDLADVEVRIPESPFEVTIDNAEVTDDGDGHDLIVIDYTFTNNADEPYTFYNVKAGVFQNNTELQSGYLPYNHPLSDDTLSYNSSTEVKKGANVKIRQAYILNDTTTPVEVEITDEHDYINSSVILTKEIQIQ